MSDLVTSGVTGIELLLMLLGLFAINEACYRVAAHRRVPAREARKSQVDLVVAALLGLLGLLLAFSFDIGESRFGKRKELVLAEANAVATTYLRADMLPAPHGDRVHDLLRRYIDERTSVRSAADLDRALADSSRLHAELWREATAVARENMGSPVVALFVASLNVVIDLHESRVTVALFQRLPPAIIGILYFVALLSVAMVGVRAGMDRTRAAAPTVALVVVVVSVIALIVSLDRPASRLFDINKRALDDTRALIDRDRSAVEADAARASAK
jgi:hypothetical protein